MKETKTYRISTSYLTAIINDDYSGLTDDEEKLINEFLNDLEIPGYHYSFDIKENSMDFTEDDISESYSDTQELNIFYIKTNN